jgi:peptide/nickel transport system substrate-binding protein
MRLSPAFTSLIFSCAVGSVSLLGCDGHPAPSKSGTLRTAVASEPSSLLGFFARGAVSDAISQQTAGALVRRTMAKGGIAFAPDLAAHWTLATDGRSVKFELAPERMWSDGTAVSTDDVVATFESLVDPRSGATRRDLASLLDETQPAVQSERGEVILRFNRPLDESVALSVALHPIVPAAVVRRGALDDLPNVIENRQPPAAGSFRVSSWVAGTRIDLDRNRPTPGLVNRIEISIIPDSAAQIGMLISGHLDHVDPIPIEAVGSLSRVKDVTIWSRGQQTLELMVVNHDREMFQSALVRSAISGAIDRDDLIRRALADSSGAPRGIAAQSPLHPLMSVARSSPSATRAPAELLDEDGWLANNAGSRSRKGRILAFDLLIPRGHAVRERTALVVQHQLQRAGVTVRIAALDFGDLMLRVRRGEFDAALVGFAVPPLPDLRAFWSSKPEGFLNFGRYRSAEMDRILDELLSPLQSDARAATTGRFEELFARDCPAVPLFWPDQIAGTRSTITPTEWTSFGFLDGVDRWAISSDGVSR